MDTLTSMQCLEIGTDLSKLQSGIADYQFANFKSLTDDQKAGFAKSIKSLADAAGMLIAYSVTIALDEAEISIQNLTTATQQINDIVKTIQNIQKWINIAGACFSLATALLELSPKGIFNGIKNLAQSIGDVENKEENA